MSTTHNFQATKHNYITPIIEEVDVRVEGGFFTSGASGDNTDMPTEEENNPW
ncbi:MAG: hypothetical protein RR330_00535 [Alistipes sp.]